MFPKLFSKPVVFLWQGQFIMYNFVPGIEEKAMKKPILIITVLGLILALNSSCNLFKSKYGCPTNGKNIGAEKLVNGDPEAEKAARKARKFKS
jgi:hypothetical protein